MRELIGFYTYSVSVSERVAFSNACLQYGIEPKHMREDEVGIAFRLPFYQKTKAETVFRQAGVGFARGELGGALGHLRQMAHHPGLIVGALLSLFLYLWLGGMVWEVRVVCRTDIDEDETLRILAECGLSEGSRLSKLDVDGLVSAFLLRDSSVAFAAVHLRGVVAEVEVIPHEIKEEPKKQGTPCNIVASGDAVVTDVTVYAGKAMVKVGQTVRAGDILVSGVVTDAGGTRLVSAVADVRGQLTRELNVTAPENLTRTVVTGEKIRAAELCVFGRSFSFGSPPEGCVTEQKQVYLFGFLRLPIRVKVWREVVTADEVFTPTPEEKLRLTEAALSGEVAALVGEGALLGLEKEVRSTGGGCEIRAKVVFESNIGKVLAFDVENN